MGRITGTTDYSGLRRRRLRDRGSAREDGDQADGLRRARRGDAGARDPGLQHVVALDRRDGRRDASPPQGRGLPLLLPGVGHAAGRDRRRRDRRGDDRGRRQLRPDHPQAADRLRGGPRLRRQPDPQLRGRRDLARAGGAGALDQADRRGGRRPERRADGPVLPGRPPRPRHRLPRRRAPERVLRRLLLRPPGHEEARRRGQAGRQVGRLGLLRERRAPDRGRRRAERRGARRAHVAEGDRRGLPGPRGGRLDRPRDRPGDDGRRRHGPAPRHLPAVHQGRPDRTRRDPGEARGRPRRSTASASRRP